MTKIRSAAVILGVIVLGTGSHAVAEIVTYDLPEETAILKPGPGHRPGAEQLPRLSLGRLYRHAAA